MSCWHFLAASIRPVVRFAIVAAALAGVAACESRPPIDVYGHKDSVYQRLVIGVPF